MSPFHGSIPRVHSTSPFHSMFHVLHTALQATALAVQWGQLSHSAAVVLLLGLHLLLGYHYDYALHGCPYTSTHVLIENTLVKYKIAKNLRMALCCQNRVSKCTNQHYGLHDSARISVHSALVTVIGLLKKKKKRKKMAFLLFSG